MFVFQLRGRGCSERKGMGEFVRWISFEVYEKDRTVRLEQNRSDKHDESRVASQTAQVLPDAFFTRITQQFAAKAAIGTAIVYSNKHINSKRNTTTHFTQ